MSREGIRSPACRPVILETDEPLSPFNRNGSGSAAGIRFASARESEREGQLRQESSGTLDSRVLAGGSDLAASACHPRLPAPRPDNAGSCEQQAPVAALRLPDRIVGCLTPRCSIAVPAAREPDREEKLAIGCSTIRIPASPSANPPSREGCDPRKHPRRNFRLHGPSGFPAIHWLPGGARALRKRQGVLSSTLRIFECGRLLSRGTTRGLRCPCRRVDSRVYGPQAHGRRPGGRHGTVACRCREGSHSCNRRPFP